MFFFLSLRQTPQGTIEPDILPQTTTTYPPTPSKANANDGEPSAYRAYITRWDTSSKPALARKILCLLVVFLHVPMNLLSILSWGIGVGLFLGIIFSVLNLVCVALAMWKLDVMRGQRLVYANIWTRHNFDYIILGLVVVYGFSFGMFVFAHMRLRSWVLFLRIIWPCLIATDLVCFISGWIATWRDVSSAPLGV